VALMPISTTLLVEHITLRTALLVYWFNILVLGAVILWSWRCASRAGLVKKGTTAEVRAALVRRITVAQSLYAFGAALCIISTYWSIGFIVLVQLNFAAAPRIPWLWRR
jgi:uncharacterized membrane protein